MQRVDGHYLYEVGSNIHPLSEFKYLAGQGGTTLDEAYFPILMAEGALEPLISRSVLQLRTSYQAGKDLLDTVRAARAKIESASDRSLPLGTWDVFAITSKLTNFEAVLRAELALIPPYLVQPKAGYDTPALIDQGVLPTRACKQSARSDL